MINGQLTVSRRRRYIPTVSQLEDRALPSGIFGADSEDLCGPSGAMAQQPDNKIELVSFASRPQDLPSWAARFTADPNGDQIFADSDLPGADPQAVLDRVLLRSRLVDGAFGATFETSSGASFSLERLMVDHGGTSAGNAITSLHHFRPTGAEFSKLEGGSIKLTVRGYGFVNGVYGENLCLEVTACHSEHTPAPTPDPAPNPTPNPIPTPGPSHPISNVNNNTLVVNVFPHAHPVHYACPDLAATKHKLRQLFQREAAAKRRCDHAAVLRIQRQVRNAVRNAQACFPQTEKLWSFKESLSKLRTLSKGVGEANDQMLVWAISHTRA